MRRKILRVAKHLIVRVILSGMISAVFVAAILVLSLKFGVHWLGFLLLPGLLVEFVLSHFHSSIGEGIGAVAADIAIGVIANWPIYWVLTYIIVVRCNRAHDKAEIEADDLIFEAPDSLD